MKMLINVSILTLAFALLIQVGAQAQNGSVKSGIKARGRGTKLILTSRGKSHALDVSKSIDAARLDQADILGNYLLDARLMFYQRTLVKLAEISLSWRLTSCVK